MKKEVLNELNYEQIVLGEIKMDGKEADESRINEILSSNEEILRRYPPEKMAESINRRLNRKVIPWGKLLIPLSAAAVFLLFFTLFPFQRTILSENTSENPEIIRLKGSKPSLYIFRGNGHEAEMLSNNTLVREKDLLQISYDSAGVKYGVILSIDGRGTVTLHFPENVYSNTRLDFGGKVYLPYSYELDDAPFFERFFFVTSDNEIDAAEIMNKAAKIAKGNKSEMLNLPADQNQQSMILFKEGVR